MARDDTADRLADYLGEHLADTGSAIELLDRLIKSEPPESASWFEILRLELREDRDVLSRLATQFGARPVMGRLAEWLAESDPAAIARTDLAPLALFLNLERLALGVLRKASLWGTLQRLAGCEPRLGHIPYERLLARANAQHNEIERRRVALAAPALMGRAA